MTRQTDLPELLCDLYEYHQLQENRRDQDTRRDAAANLRRTGEPEVLKDLDSLAAKGQFSWEAMRFGSRKEGSGTLRFPDRHDLELMVIGELDAAENLLKRSRSELRVWPSVVRWVARETGRTVEKVDSQLQAYCAGRSGERSVKRAKPQSRVEENRWVHADAKKRSVSNLGTELGRLDTPEKVEELLRLVWDQWPTEAASIPLPKPSRPATPLAPKDGPSPLADEAPERASPGNSSRHAPVNAGEAAARIHLFDVLVKLRCDQIDTEGDWSSAIRARAEAIAERDTRKQTEARQRLLEQVDAGELPHVGQTDPDGRWIDGLREIDGQAYRFYQHRGDPESPACVALAEAELKQERVTEWVALDGELGSAGGVWRLAPGAPWCFVVGKLQERAMPFSEAELFEAARLVQFGQPGEVPLHVREFVQKQDDSGYTEEIVATLRANYHLDGLLVPVDRGAGGEPAGDTGDGTEPSYIFEGTTQECIVKLGLSDQTLRNRCTDGKPATDPTGKAWSVTKMRRDFYRLTPATPPKK